MAKQDIYITLDLDEIEYEVKDKTYLTGRGVAAAGGSVKQSSALQATDDAVSRDMTRRHIDNAVSRLRSLVHEWGYGGRTISNNLLGDTNRVKIQLQMPMNFATTVTDDISSTMHRYVTEYAIGEWYGAVDRDRQKDWLAKAAAELPSLLRALHSRVRPSRRTEGGGEPGSGEEPGTPHLWHDVLVWHDDDTWSEAV